jgi:hypothetical protein
VPSITEYQVRQTATGAEVDVVRTGPVDPGELASTLEAALARAGLPAPAVVVHAVARIPRPVSGKLKRFIALA